MSVVKCPHCGASYRIADKLLGRRGKCKKCGEPFMMVVDEVDDDLLGGLSQGETQARNESAYAVADASAPVPAFPGFEVSSSLPPEEEQTPTGMGTYLRDVAASLFFFTRLGNCITFTVVVFLVFLQFPLLFAGGIGYVGIIIVLGWYRSFLLNVVLDGAAGERDLPDMVIGDVVETIVFPLLKYMASWVVALVPFAIGLGYLIIFDQLVFADAYDHFRWALKGEFAAAFDQTLGGSPLLGGILLLAMTFWPMMLLVVAVGGIRSLVRFDLMVITIIKTLPAYSMVVILAYVGVVGPSLITSSVLKTIADSGNLGGLLGAGAALMVLQVFANIFTMRVTGLYYHHFKHQFAWSWG